MTDPGRGVTGWSTDKRYQMCPYCMSQNVCKGTVMAPPRGGFIVGKPTLKNLFGRNTIAVHASACLDCGIVSLSLDEKAKHRLNNE